MITVENNKIVSNVLRTFLRWEIAIIGNAVFLSTTNYNVGKGTFEKALQLMPLSNTVPIQNLPAPSYVYAILMDDSIRQDDY